jgi:hypothetical protein
MPPQMPEGAVVCSFRPAMSVLVAFRRLPHHLSENLVENCDVNVSMDCAARPGRCVVQFSVRHFARRVPFRNGRSNLQQPMMAYLSRGTFFLSSKW